MTITQELIDAERKRFETSAQLKYLDFSKTKDAWGKEIYFYTHVEAMWQGWQAAISQQAVQGGYVLVPKEPTNEMIYAGMEAIDNFKSPITPITCYTQMIAAAPSDNKALVESEPYAWHVLSGRWNYVEMDYEIAKGHAARGARLTPVYTHPTPADTVKQDALRLDWIEDNSKDYGTHLEVRLNDSNSGNGSLRQRIDTALQAK
jgi:hypothetical protein